MDAGDTNIQLDALDEHPGKRNAEEVHYQSREYNANHLEIRAKKITPRNNSGSTDYQVLDGNIKAVLSPIIRSTPKSSVW